MNDQSRDMSALKRWFELRFGFRTRFNITWWNTSVGNEQLCEKSGVQAFLKGTSSKLGTPEVMRSGLNAILRE